MDRKNVEAIHPLSPMQQAMLFHSLHEGPAGSALLQLRCTLRGDLEPEAFERAWQRVVERHAALRSSVHWQELDQPLQAVMREVTVPWTHRDLRGLAPEEQQAALDAFLEEDRARGLELTRAPVMRLALLRTAEQTWRLVWSCHHVLLDGWSGALVLQEALAACRAGRSGEAPLLPPAPAYRDYVAWLRQQELARAESAWRAALAGIPAPTPLPLDPAPDASGEPGEERIELTPEAAGALERAARRHRLTLGTILQGAWALLLSRRGGEEVIFGTTVSGRSSGPPGVEEMAGLFINTLPVRARVPRAEPAAAFLRRLQEQQAALLEFAYVPPAQLHGWSGLPPARRLFDSLVVFENHPAGFATSGHAGGLEVRDFSGGITSNLPLTLVIAPGTGLAVHLLFDGRRFDRASARRVLDDYRALLERLAAGAERPVAELLEGIGASAGGNRETGDGASAATPQLRAPGTGSRNPDAGSRPPDALELRLARIWEQVLDVHPVGVRDDFFELGGHSILAARLFEEIERALGRKLPMSTLFRLSTVESLARALRDEGWTPPWSSLVPIQTGGDRPPLFCVHSWDDNMLAFGQMARHLGPDQPVYGLQAVGLDGTTKPPTRIEEIAAHHLREIREAVPQGPYCLFGMCFGALVGLEMARQLRAAGEEVPVLIVLDTTLRRHLPGRRLGALEWTARHYALRLSERWREGTLGPAFRAYLQERVRKLRKRSRKAIRKSRRAASLHLTGRAYTLKDYHDALRRAQWQYVPAVYPGRVSLLRSTVGAEPGGRDRMIARWSDLAAGGLSVFAVPGEHARLMQEPHLAHVAARVRQCMDEAGAGGREAGARVRELSPIPDS